MLVLQGSQIGRRSVTPIAQLELNTGGTRRVNTSHRCGKDRIDVAGRRGCGSGGSGCLQVACVVVATVVHVGCPSLRFPTCIRCCFGGFCSNRCNLELGSGCRGRSAAILLEPDRWHRGMHLVDVSHSLDFFSSDAEALVESPIQHFPFFRRRARGRWMDSTLAPSIVCRRPCCKLCRWRRGRCSRARPDAHRRASSVL